MILNSSLLIALLLQLESYTQQESVSPPPPYQAESDQDHLPCYTESSPLAELEPILTRFAPRWDDQRVYLNNGSSSTKVSQLLDRMETYRHKEQDWACHNQSKMRQLTKNMYHIQCKPCSGRKKIPSLSSAKSKYQKMTLSIAKEREHLMGQMKKIRSSSSSSCTEEFDQFLDSVYVTSSQLRMSNQCATRLVTV
jgi:hypothetical protein